MTIDEALNELRNERAVRFSVAVKIATKFFGQPRIKGSHHVFKMPWVGAPINLQKEGANAKPYQVKQLRAALLKLKGA